MNLPSLDKYENDVVPGGTIYVDSTLIERKVTRTDVKVCYIPATKMAAEKGLKGLANMIIVGKVLGDFDEFTTESLEKALGKCISARHADMLENNRKALECGRDFS